MRRAAKVDGNQESIVRVLRAVVGCTVLDLSKVGGGCADLLVGYKGKNYLLEVKRPGEKIRRDKRGELQRKFHDTWQGGVCIVRSPNEALMVLGL